MDEPGLRFRSSPPDREARTAVLVAGEETGGRCGLVETVEERGGFAPRHLHHLEDETIYVIEGCLSVWVAGDWIEVPTGTAVFLPRGVEHARVAATEKARVLSFFAPAGFEGFDQEMADTGPLDVERLVTVAARYGCEISGPTPQRSPVDQSPPETAPAATDRDAKTGKLPNQHTEAPQAHLADATNLR